MFCGGMYYDYECGGSDVDEKADVVKQRAGVVNATKETGQSGRKGTCG